MSFLDQLKAIGQLKGAREKAAESQNQANRVQQQLAYRVDPVNEVKRIGEAIKFRESSGNYGAIGKVADKAGHRAIGAYQVMEHYIGPWSKEIIGREVSKEEFLSNPKLQDLVALGKMAKHYKKYGNVKDVASIWFTGGPLIANAKKKDVNGVSGSKYATDVEKIYQDIQMGVQPSIPRQEFGSYMSQTIKEDVSRAPGLVKDIVRGTARTGGSIVTSLMNSYMDARGYKSPEELLTVDPDAQNKIMGGIQRFIFGDEPLQTMEQNVKDTRQTLESIGVSPKFSGPIALPAVIAFTALDFQGGGAAKKTTQEIIKEIAKSGSKRDIAKILKQAGTAPELIDDTAKNLVKIKDPQSVYKALARLDRLQSKVGSIAPPGTPPILRERGLATTYKASNVGSTAGKQIVEQNPRIYAQQANEDAIKFADNLVNQSTDDARAFLDQTAASPDARFSAVAERLIEHYAKAGKTSNEMEVFDFLAKKLTGYGQASQIIGKLFGKMSPQAILKRANRIIEEVNANKWFWQKRKSLDSETAQRITRLAKELKGTKDEALKEELYEELAGIFQEIKPPTIGRKISSAQTIAQLVNPKTILTRNPLGNELLYRVDRLQKYLASPVDWAKSMVTGGDRVVTFRTVNQGEYWKNWLQGWRAGWKGLNPGGLTTQFDFAQGLAFKAKWNPLHWMEKTLGGTLKAFDYAAFMRAKNQTIGELAYLKAINEGKRGKEAINAAKGYALNMDANAVKIADDYGKYVTFQDDNVLSVGLSGLKKGLNLGKDFGVGDLLLKYPRTPGSLIMRSLEYSPVGVLRGLYDMAVPLLKGKAINQREVLLGLSRGITGTLGFTALGYFLYDKGIITAAANKDRDVNNLEKSIGLGQYRVNLSALKRFVLSGFEESAAKRKEGDKMYSYDWAQPIAASITMGARANQAMEARNEAERNKGLYADVPSEFAASVAGGIDSVVEQPVFSGIRRAFQARSIEEGVTSLLEGTLSSFTPTVLNQIRQYSDPTARETYDPSVFQRAMNRAKAKVPGLADNLPVKYDTFGKPVSYPENPSIFNVFLNPGFLSTFKPTPEAKLVLDIYDSIGERKQFPKEVPRKLEIYGQSFQLSGDQISSFQKNLGSKTQVLFNKLATNDKFLQMPPEAQAKILERILDKLYQIEKIKALSKEQRRVLLQGMTPEQKRRFVQDLL